MTKENQEISELQGLIARDAYAARDFMPQLGWFLFYSVLFLAILPEYQFAYIATELSMRGWDGVLTGREAFYVPIIAAVICMVTVATFHWCIKKMSDFDGGRYVVWILLIIGLMTISQPMINLLSELRFGNSINSATTGQQSLQNQLLTGGLMIRALFILAAAFIAGIGTLGMHEAIKGMWKARRSSREAQTAAEVVHMIDKGHEGVKAANAEGMAYHRDLVSQLALATTDGFAAMSREVRTYLKGSDGLMLNPDQWVSGVVEQFSKPSTPADPKIAALVRARLKRHAIDLTELPTRPADLSDEDRASLRRYASWLLEQANYDGVYKSTMIKTGA